MEFSYIFTIVPAEYQADAQFLAYLWLKTLGCSDKAETVLAEGVSPTGDLPATHFICSRKCTQKYIDIYLEETTNRSAKIFDWCYDGVTEDKDIALTHFATMLMEKDKALEFLGLKTCK